MATLAEIRSRVSAKLGFDTTAAGAEEVLIDGWANEAVLQILLETKVYIQAGTFSLSANTAEYDIQKNNTSILLIDQFVDSNSIPLIRVQEADIFDLRRASAVASSGQRRWALFGAGLLSIWPTPSAAETLTMYYVARPTAMSSGTHDPASQTYGGIPSEYHKAIEFYCLWQGADYDDDSTSAQGDRYFGQYQLWLSKIRKDMKIKGGRRQPRAKVGIAGSRLASDPART